MSHKIKAAVRDEIVVVHFDYQPAERETLEYPGCDASVDITWVTFEGEPWDITAVLHDEYIAALEVECMESMGE